MNLISVNWFWWIGTTFLRNQNFSDIGVWPETRLVRTRRSLWPCPQSQKFRGWLRRSLSRDTKILLRHLWKVSNEEDKSELRQSHSLQDNGSTRLMVMEMAWQVVLREKYFGSLYCKLNKTVKSNWRIQIQWGCITCKYTARWLYLSRMKKA